MKHGIEAGEKLNPYPEVVPPDAARLQRCAASFHGHSCVKPANHAGDHENAHSRWSPSVNDPDARLQQIREVLEQVWAEVPFSRKAQMMWKGFSLDPSILTLQELAATLRCVQQERDYWEKWASHVDDVQTRRLAESHQHQQALRAEVQRLSAQVEDLEFAAVKKCGVCGLSHMASTYNGNGISGWAECHYYKEVQRLTVLADKHHQAVVVAEEHVQRLTAERDEALKIAEHDDLKWLALDYQKRGDLLSKMTEKAQSLRALRAQIQGVINRWKSCSNVVSPWQIDQCADELKALLSVLPPDQKEVKP